MPFYKIVIKGKTPYDIQGVNFRETIVKITSELDFIPGGQVRNEKGSSSVEILFLCENFNEANKYKVALERNLYEKNKMIKKKNIQDITGPEPITDGTLSEKDFREFKTIREDDLTEMVWALQNAGKALLLQQELKNEMHKIALKAELEAAKDLIKKIKDRKNSFKECFTCIAIHNCIAEPPFDGSILAKLHFLCRFIDSVNRMISDEKDENIDIALDFIEQHIDEIFNGLK